MPKKIFGSRLWKVKFSPTWKLSILRRYPASIIIFSIWGYSYVCDMIADGKKIPSTRGLCDYIQGDLAAGFHEEESGIH